MATRNGNRLLDLHRRHRGLYARVARKVGVSATYVSLLANGKRQNERIQTELLKELRKLRQFWREDQGQDIAEYAVVLAVILVLVVGTIQLIGGNANNAFSATASSIGQ
jgi:Flp pilus assembly pilin Flp